MLRKFRAINLNFFQFKMKYLHQLNRKMLCEFAESRLKFDEKFKIPWDRFSFAFYNA